MSGTIWLTGLPAAGKSTLAHAIAERLRAHGLSAEILDGDVLRAGVSADLGFSAADRDEQARRAGELAITHAVSGTVAVVALVSPYRASRDAVRARHAAEGLTFVEVWVDTPLAECERRDPKGLYRRARAGEITAMTGVDDPYEPPAAPELRTDGAAPQAVAEQVAALLDSA